MYTPEAFAITDRHEIFRFIEANAFGQLISTVAGQYFATHMPFLLSGDRCKMIGHVARKNPQHLAIDGQEVLIILQGPHEYISPSWYLSAGVPTWNYQAVHIYGTCKVFSNPGSVKWLVDSLTHRYEAAFAQPWQPDYPESMLSAIVGLEIAITDIQCKYKLSQNRSAEDRQKVVEHLQQRGAVAMASAMSGE